MNVVKKDKVISGMHKDELRRCEVMLAGLRKSIAGLPKGSLSERRKRLKKTVYSYYSLKYRSGEKVVNKHIPNDEAPALIKKLDQRKKFEKEMLSYKKRIDYLSKILESGTGSSSAARDLA